MTGQSEPPETPSPAPARNNRHTSHVTRHTSHTPTPQPANVTRNTHHLHLTLPHTPPPFPWRRRQGTSIKGLNFSHEALAQAEGRHANGELKSIVGERKQCFACSVLHVTRHMLHVTRYMLHVTRHTSHVTRHAPLMLCFEKASHILESTEREVSQRCTSTAMKRVTRHTSHVTRHTSHVTRHTSHITRRTSHVTRHTSHINHQPSHVTRHLGKDSGSFRHCKNATKSDLAAERLTLHWPIRAEAACVALCSERRLNEKCYSFAVDDGGCTLVDVYTPNS